MFDDMRAQEIYPTVASGYRTSKKQQSLLDEKIESFIAQGYSRSDAATEALKWVSAVGYSEHQTGLAVDINADGVNSNGNKSKIGLQITHGNMGSFFGIQKTKLKLLTLVMSHGTIAMSAQNLQR